MFTDYKILQQDRKANLVENISFSKYLAGIEFKALCGALVVANSTNNEGLDLKTVVLKMHFSTSTRLVLLNSLGDLEG